MAWYPKKAPTTPHSIDCKTQGRWVNMILIAQDVKN